MVNHTGIEDKPLDNVHHLEHNEDVEKIQDVPDLAPLDPKADARVRRKIDFVLMPMFCFIYALNFLDKTALTYASVMELFKDTGLKADQYSWVASIYSFGYLLGTYPQVVAQQRLPIAKVTAFNIIAWGIVVCCTALCKSYTTLLVVRFILGFFEASITPAIINFTATWYKPREQATRIGIWGSMTSWGSILGGGVAYALAEGSKQGKYSISAWKIVYLWLGGMTVFCGILWIFIVPDRQDKAWFLDDEGKRVAIRRTLETRQHMEEKEWKWSQVREVFRDPQVAVLAIMTVCSNIPTGGLINFFAIIVSNIGYSTTETLLITMANSSLGVATIFFLWLGEKIRFRTLTCLIPLAIAVTGCSVLWALPLEQKTARLTGFFFTIWQSIATYIVTSMITTNIAGRTKKTTVSGGYLVLLCVSNIVGPQTFRAKHAPRYAPALITMVAMTAANFCFMIVLFLYYRRENAKRDRAFGAAEKINSTEYTDLTDRENKNFRYVY